MAALHLNPVVAAAENRLWRVSLKLEAGQMARAEVPPALATGMLRVMSGLDGDAARQSAVFVGGKDVTEKLPGPEHLGCVPAGESLFPHLTVRENITYGSRLRNGRAVTASRFANITEALDLRLVLDERPYATLSAARRLAVAVARSAIFVPEVLVLDLPANPMKPDRLADMLRSAASAESETEPMAVLVLSEAEEVDEAIPECVAVDIDEHPGHSP